jgi:hypothetical protein
VSVESALRPGREWQYLKADLIDDRLTTTIAYDPAVARSEVLESALSTWLPTVEDVAGGDGLAPDGPLRINIDCSVPELVNAPWWVRARRRTDPPEPV